MVTVVVGVIALVVGAVLAVTVAKVRNWVTKQVNDAKTHLPK